MTSSSGSVNVAGPQVLTDESLNKFAWYDTENPHLANWEIRINHKKATLSNVTIHDTIVGSTEKILKDTIRLSTVQMDQYGNDIAGTSTPVDLTGKLTMSDNDQTFTINVGNVNGEQYRLTYQSTYTEGTNLNNKLTLTSVNQTYTFDARFSRASSGGSGSGDLANKIKLTKVDEDDNTITLANAIFTVTKPDGTTFDLTTAADGTVTSEALVQGTYKVKEKTAPSGYELNDTEYTLEVTSAGGALQTITDKPIKTDISVTKTWVGPKAGPVTIHLFANGTDTGTTLTLDDSNNWTGSFSNVRKYDQSGTEIQYTVTEDAVNGYDSTITGDQTTGFTITNTEQPKNVNPPKQNATTPKTSDSTNIYLYFGMLFVGIITSGYLFAKRKSYR